MIESVDYADANSPYILMLGFFWRAIILGKVRSLYLHASLPCEALRVSQIA